MTSCFTVDTPDRKGDFLGAMGMLFPLCSKNFYKKSIDCASRQQIPLFPFVFFSILKERRDTMSGILGICGIIFGLHSIFDFKEGGFHGFLDVPSLVFLGILPPCIMLLSHRLGDFWTGIQILFRAVFHNTIRAQGAVIQSLSDCSAKIRGQGIG